MTVPIFLVIRRNRVMSAEVCSSEEALREMFKEESVARGRPANDQEVENGLIEFADEDETLQTITPLLDYQQIVNSLAEMPDTWLPGLLHEVVAAAIVRNIYAEPAALVRVVQNVVDRTVAALELFKQEGDNVADSGPKQ